MLRRIVVIVAAVTMLWSGPLCAQSSDVGGRAQSEPVAAPKGVAVPQPAAPSEVAAPQKAATLPKVAVEKAASDSIRSLGLQTEFPKKVEPLRIPVPAEVLWLGLAVAAALILYALRDALPFWRGTSDEGWDMPAGESDAAALDRHTDALAAADALSRDGRFVEAMHTLLLQSLAEIRQHLDAQFADSMTSREILRGAKLTSHGRASLHQIVAAVERTYFGAYPAKPDDYVACRQSFESLRYALRGGAPA
jgi:hypothetical protein